MTSSIFIGFIGNTALLPALVLFYDTVVLRRLGKKQAAVG